MSVPLVWLAQEAGLERIPLGTVIPKTPPEPKSGEKSWNRVVLLAKPRVASGDVDSLSQAIRDTVTTYTLCILASVEKELTAVDAKPSYRLAGVGAGYAMDLNDELIIVTSSGYRKVGAKLGLIQRRMLTTNEQQLETVQVLARTSAVWLFDTPALMASRGEHFDLTMRHFVWIDQRTGQTAALIWLLNDGEGGGLQHPECTYAICCIGNEGRSKNSC